MIHFATEQNANMRQRSVRDTGAGVRDVLEAFEDWLDQQVLPPDIAEHANFVLAYLRMEQPLPAPLQAKLAGHVAAVSSGRRGC
jgi:hypothetical protein